MVRSVLCVVRCASWMVRSAEDDQDGGGIGGLLFLIIEGAGEAGL